MSTLNTYNLKSPDSANTNLALDASGNVAIQAGSASAPSIYVTGDTNTGLYSPGADQIAVTTGGTARLFIDSSGRLLVGTTTSNGAQLEVNRPQSVATGLSALLSSPQFSITNSSNWGFPVGAVFKTPLANGGAIVDNAAIWAEFESTDNAYLGFATRSSGTVAERMRITNNGTLRLGDGTTYYHTITGAGGNTALEITANAGRQNALTAGTIKFLNSDSGGAITERMRISSAGVTTLKGNGVTLEVSSENNNVYKINLQDAGTIRSYVGASSSNIFDVADSSVTQRLYVTSSGAAYNSTGTWGTISDQTLKTDIEDASSQWNDVKAIRFRKYRFIADVAENPNSNVMLGVVAQELEGTSPGLVETNEKGIKAVKQSVLLMKAAKALQEAMERIETLEAKVAALESA